MKLKKHNRYAYSPITERQDFTWPDGKHLPSGAAYARFDRPGKYGEGSQFSRSTAKLRPHLA